MRSFEEKGTQDLQHQAVPGYHRDTSSGRRCQDTVHAPARALQGLESESRQGFFRPSMDGGTDRRLELPDWSFPQVPPYTPDPEHLM